MLKWIIWVCTTVYLDTDGNLSCVDIFTVDSNAQMDLLGVYDVYLDTVRN